MTAFRQSRRDDMESFGYTVWSLAVCALPWHRSYYPKENQKNLYEIIRREKSKFWKGRDDDKV